MVVVDCLGPQNTFEVSAVQLTVLDFRVHVRVYCLGLGELVHDRWITGTYEHEGTIERNNTTFVFLSIVLCVCMFQLKVIQCVRVY